MNAAQPSAPAHQCFSEGELLELAQGLVTRELALRRLAEIHGCRECSLLLAEAGRVVATEGLEAAHVSPILGARALFRAGDVLAQRFRIVRSIGSGGMGDVYEALDLELGERVALKTLRAGLARSARSIERFKQELRLARRVVHPHVCRVLELGRHDDADAAHYFLTMELLSGEPLSERLQRARRLPVSDVLRIAEDLCAGLHAIHAQSILHRDIKTNNVMMCRSGDEASERAVLLDFGIARPVVRDQPALTTGGVVGTPDYMAPEQLRGEALTPASDVYAMGVVLFELLVGQLPFAGSDPMARVVKRLETRPAQPSSFRSDLPAGLDDLVGWCLEPRPADRPQHAGELWRAIAALRAGASTARPRSQARAAPTLEATPAKLPVVRRARMVRSYLYLLAALVLLGVAAGGLVMLLPGGSASQAKGAKTPASRVPSVRGVNAAPERAAPPGSPVSPPISGASAQPVPPLSAQVVTSGPAKAALVAPRSTRDKSARGRERKSSCTPPYYYDERGLRVYREDCL